MTQFEYSRRQLLVHGSIGLGVVLAGPSLLSACSKSDNTGAGAGASGSGALLAKLKAAGKITVGISGEQPYAFLDSGKLTGEDPTVQQAVWKAVGIPTVEAKQVSFDSLIPGLVAGDFDAISAGMFITPKRCAQVAFSDPIYVAPEAFMVAKGNPKNLSSFESAAKAGVTVGVFGGAVEGDYLKKAGVSAGNIVTVPDLPSGITQLQQGRIQAIALTSITLLWALKKDPSIHAEVTTPFIPVVDGKKQLGAGAAVFRKGDDALRKAFNSELQKLLSSGGLTKLIEPFGFGKETVPPPEATTAALCKA